MHTLSPIVTEPGATSRNVAVVYKLAPEFLRVRGDGGLCNGDSGTPLLTAAHRLEGVLSRGAAACDGRDEFVRLRSITEWIGSVTGSG